ncbi:MAG TPA: tryptophan synthase subunit alpha, partial [Vicinamibacteria bacterium]
MSPRSLLKRALARGPLMSPFLVLGDPTPDLSLALAKEAVDSGAGALEIGFPYGDPVADGTAIQRADLRALRSGTSTTGAFSILARIHEARP